MDTKPPTTHGRRRDRWMRLKDPDLLRSVMKARGMSTADLAAEIGTTRQFVWQLLNSNREDAPGDLARKRSCKPGTALLIEEALGVDRGLLFDRMESSAGERESRSNRRGRGAAA